MVTISDYTYYYTTFRGGSQARLISPDSTSLHAALFRCRSLAEWKVVGVGDMLRPTIRELAGYGGGLCTTGDRFRMCPLACPPKRIRGGLLTLPCWSLCGV